MLISKRSAPELARRRFPGFLALVAGMLLMPAALSAGTITVDGACTLTDAILSANSDSDVGSCSGAIGPDTLVLDVDVLLVAADTVNSTLARGSFAGLPEVTTELTIEAGLASTVERDSTLPCPAAAPDGFRLLTVAGAAGMLTLRGLTLEGGCAEEGGAVLVHQSASATFEEVTFRANRSTAPGPDDGGGAIRLRSFGTVLVTESSFLDNRAEPGGTSGLSAVGGAITRGGSGSLGISDTLFRGNQAIGAPNDSGAGGTAEGGALSLVASCTRCRFEDNRAIAGAGTTDGGFAAGGACHRSNSFSDAVFVGNQALAGDGNDEGGDASGGAFSLGGECTHCLFSENSAIGGNGNRGGSARGGAVHAASATISRSTFVANLARGGTGIDSNGGHALGGGFQTLSNYDLIQVTFSANVAQGGTTTGTGPGGVAAGGGAFMDSDSNINTVHQLTASANRALGGAAAGGGGLGLGGGIHIDNDGGTFDNMVLAGNLAAAGGAAPTANDCTMTVSLASAGSNWVQSPGSCVFADATDVTGVPPVLLPLGTYGCIEALPNGRCLPVHPLGITSPALDQGSCAVSGATVDAPRSVAAVGFPGDRRRRRRLRPGRL